MTICRCQCQQLSARSRPIIVIRSVCTVDPGVPPERGAHLDRGVATPRSRCREVRHSSRELLKENPRFLFVTAMHPSIHAHKGDDCRRCDVFIFIRT